MKKFSLYVLLAAMVLGGCKKQLDQNNAQQIGDVNAYLTIDHVQLGVNGAYQFYQNYIGEIYKSAIVSDEGRLGADNAGQGALTYRFQYSSDATTGGDVLGGYAEFYGMIDQINRVLPHVYTVTGAVSQARRDEIQGQLLALRGIAHFQLLLDFGGNYNPSGLGIAIVTESNPVGRPARNTMLESITAIEKDLSDAKALLPAVTPASFRDTVMNKVNVAAYQARVALYKGDFANAITYSSEVISSGVKPLVTGDTFRGIWTDAEASSVSGISETLFRIRFANNGVLGSLFTTTGNLIYIAPSDKLVAQYTADDIRLGSYIGTRASDGAHYVNKYYSSSRGGRVVDLKAIRTSEMYLIRAEAYAKSATPNLAGGTADLNTLRAQRITGYTPVADYASGTDLLAATIQERFKELAFEASRFYDLRRNGLPVQRFASDANPEWQTLPADSYKFVFPVPQDAQLANPNLAQNPGY